MVLNVNVSMPAEWKTAIRVFRGRGRDKYGDPLPDVGSFYVDDCLVGSGAVGMLSLNETDRRNDDVLTKVFLYAPPDTDIRSRDAIVVPPDHFMRGEYEIAGEPMRWPQGTVVELRRVDGTGEVSA